MALGKKFRLNRLRLKKQEKDGQKPLLNNMMAQHIEATDGSGGQILNTRRTDQSVVYPDLISTESEMSKEVLCILTKILSTESNAQDVENAADMMNKWSQLNDVIIHKKGRYPQDWLCEFLQIIDESVERHFHILSQDKTQTSEFLQRIEDVMYGEVCRLTPVLKDAGLLGYLIQSYSHQMLITLNLLLNRSLTVEEVFRLLYWTKRVFFSFSAHSQDVFRVLDPLVFSGWVERAKKKLLTVLKKEISKALNNILRIEEKHDDNRMSTKEEWFIQMHLDVTQFLHGVIQQVKAFSLTLMHEVQMLCLGELHSFVQNYVYAERKRLENLQLLKTNLVYLCRIISNCIKLRCLTVQMNNLDKNKSDDDTVYLLKKLEDQVLSIVQKMMKHKAEESLKSYFKRDDEHIYNLMKEIQIQCESLPQTEAAKEIKMIIVNLAYDCVSRVYLDRLMKSKFKNLERRWENVQEKIEQDVLIFHNLFTELNGSDEQNQLLKRMSEVLFCSDVEALKLICATLFKDFPEDSEHYLPGLLRWNRTLSNRQVRDVLDVSRLECLNDTRVKQVYPLMGLCCCLCC